MAILNPHTGESVLRGRDGSEVRLVFTEEAILALEQALDVGPLELAQKLTTGAVKLSELATLVWAGANAWRTRNGQGRELTHKQALEAIKACGGMTAVLAPVAEALVRCSALGLVDDEEGPDAALEGAPADPTVGSASASALP